MKKLLIFFIAVFALSDTVFAEDLILNGNISFDWVTKSQLERDENIAEIKNKIYSNNIVEKYKKNDFRLKYSDFLKDKDRNKHYYEIVNGQKENESERLAGFYLKGEKIMYMYGLNYKNDIYTTYYYDMLGNLKYIDKMSENYPNYPYYSLQYRINGELAGAIYFQSYDTQYVYKNGKFKGLWFKDTMFNSKAKKIMTRTNY